ncbi:hypothetical protein GLAREA_01654 [Glarea lozoyensis ATCC 20868]|uniref:Uncharacterized protein n=1 Tax=Glarea lozoyensis (strain ATCC 20868 / MF5171) TaxID=1116229 RepID=S3CGZ2_GLAL2|nr:uncharacterized protein GLAREA_01654 [Glarea lozoyensis ATCC 20868]EPE25742.1 hypothetical protein GLAREA_01654 [Glarea lozoyensis ATCC 20868]
MRHSATVSVSSWLKRPFIGVDTWASRESRRKRRRANSPRPAMLPALRLSFSPPPSSSILSDTASIDLRRHISSRGSSVTTPHCTMCSRIDAGHCSSADQPTTLTDRPSSAQSMEEIIWMKSVEGRNGPLACRDQPILSGDSSYGIEQGALPEKRYQKSVSGDTVVVASCFYLPFFPKKTQVPDVDRSLHT